MTAQVQLTKSLGSNEHTYASEINGRSNIKPCCPESGLALTQAVSSIFNHNITQTNFAVRYIDTSTCLLNSQQCKATKVARIQMQPVNELHGLAVQDSKFNLVAVINS